MGTWVYCGRGSIYGQVGHEASRRSKKTRTSFSWDLIDIQTILFVMFRLHPPSFVVDVIKGVVIAVRVSSNSITVRGHFTNLTTTKRIGIKLF